jgi:hypothetical protein
MSDSLIRSPRLSERTLVGLVGLIERLALRLIHRGPFRRRVLAQLDQVIAGMHSEICGKGRQR